MKKNKSKYLHPQAELIDIDAEHDILASSPSEDNIPIFNDEHIEEDDEIL